MGKRNLIIVTVLFLCIFFAWTRERTRHFIGHHDWDNAVWVSAAKNYQRYGLIETKLQQVTTPYETEAGKWSTYTTHPPGISLITYVGLEFLGDTEFASRMLPIMTSLLAAALLYRLSHRLYGEQTAPLTLFFFGFMPIMVYFNAKIGHEQYTLPLILLTLNLIVKPSRYQLIAYGLIGFMGGFISWGWYFFVACLVLYTWREQRSLRSIQFLLVGTTLAFLCLGSLYVIQAGAITQLWHAFWVRSANTMAVPITLTGWFSLMVTRLLWLPTPVVLFFAIIWLWQHKPAIEVVPALSATLYGLVFWQGNYKHDYWLYYLFAPLAMWGALGFYRTLLRFEKPPQRLWAGLHGVLLVLFLVGSYRWSVGLFNVDVIPRRYEWGIKANQATELGEVVVTNLEDNGPHIGYYAQRDVIFGGMLGTVLDPARPPEWGFYIYCLDEDETPPVQLLDFPHTVDADKASVCYLVDLIP